MIRNKKVTIVMPAYSTPAAGSVNAHSGESRNARTAGRYVIAATSHASPESAATSALHGDAIHGATRRSRSGGATKSSASPAMQPASFTHE